MEVWSLNHCSSRVKSSVISFDHFWLHVNGNQVVLCMQIAASQIRGFSQSVPGTPGDCAMGPSMRIRPVIQ